MYLTTAISYLNGDPHIGHQLEIVVSDIISRHNKFKTDNVVFQTGTDEHGQKISDKAKSVGLSPIELCNQNVIKFQTLYEGLRVKYDNFVRTSSLSHYKTVQYVFNQLKSTGDIYLGKYTGWYCSREETFVTELEAQKCNYIDEVSGKKLERIEEESYFFRMSKYQPQLIKYFQEHPEFISSPNFYNHILKRLEEPLQDLSISRTNITWGIPLENNHVCYVWFDALLNYLSGIDYFELDPSNKYHGHGKTLWNNTYHVIGKDIIWFHSIIWTSMLMALNIPLPKQLIIHGFVIDKNGTKMSKSLGNVLDPFELLQDYPTDTIRFYMIRYNNLEHDMKFSTENLVKFHNTELANNIGNLVNRLTNLIHKNCAGKVPVIKLNDDELQLLKILDTKFILELDSLYSTYSFKDISQQLLDLFHQLNQWLTEKEPWKIKDNDDLRNKILRIGLERLYQISHSLLPIMPYISKLLFVQLGLPPLKYDKLIEINQKLNPDFDNLQLEKTEKILFPKI